jgi:D-sedoheptulose 7-phosphate isomerase
MMGRAPGKLRLVETGKDEYRNASMTTQNFEMALAHVAASLEEGAKLRAKVARDCGRAIVEAATLVAGCLRSGGKILFCGNGGSAADAQHLAAEFVGRFILDRQALPAIALTTDSSILTAVGNDYGFEQVFSRQIQALGRPGDVTIGISTSGQSPNVIAAMREARKKGLKSIGLAGKDGGALAKCVDIPIIIPSQNTARIQECHITVGHLICELVEKDLE